MGARRSTDITAPARKITRRRTLQGGVKFNGRSKTTANSRAVNDVDDSHSVTGKLEALKSLIPTQNGGDVDADQLFEETADYILLLRTQVSILQKLVEFYGGDKSSCNSA